MIGFVTTADSGVIAGFGTTGCFGNAFGTPTPGFAVSTSFKGSFGGGGAATGFDTGADGSGCLGAEAGFGVVKEREIVGAGRTALIVEPAAITAGMTDA